MNFIYYDYFLLKEIKYSCNNSIYNTQSWLTLNVALWIEKYSYGTYFNLIHSKKSHLTHAACLGTMLILNVSLFLDITIEGHKKYRLQCKVASASIRLISRIAT